jgi:hypothetical protein
MPLLRIEAFGGQIPLQDDRLLQGYHAAFAENAYVGSGTIKPISAIIPVHIMADPFKRAFFRIPKAKAGVDNIVDSFWLEFDHEDTWVVRNPTSGLADGGRFYWSDGLTPPKMTTMARLLATQPPLLMGIPSPPVAPGVSVSGGSTPVETRAYAYTWASGSHEEGPPSPPTLATGNANGTWNITMTAPTVGHTTDRDLQYVRIYRTITNLQGIATFFFVVELPIATLAYADTIPSATVGLNDQLRSMNWLPPPDDLKGMVNMANGMIAGFRDTEVWICEPYRPHAWPPQYLLSVESKIIGLGVQQQSLVILTEGWTYIATGIRPDAMSLTKVATLEPCTSMGSIVSAPEGVMYTSVNGLMVVSSGIGINSTAGMVRKDQWPTLLYLPNLHATYINRSYVAFSSPSSGVFQVDAFQVPEAQVDPLGAFETIDFSGTRDGAIISIGDERAAFMRLHSEEPVINVLQDVWTGEALILRNGVIEHIDLRKPYPRLSNYRWRSKVYQTPYVENWAAAKVFFTPPPGPPADGPTYFRFYADGRMVYERQIQVSGEQFRLPSGFKSHFVQWELEGQLEIYNVQIATSARELRNA